MLTRSTHRFCASSGSDRRATAARAPAFLSGPRKDAVVKGQRVSLRLTSLSEGRRRAGRFGDSCVLPGRAGEGLCEPDGFCAWKCLARKGP